MTQLPDLPDRGNISRFGVFLSLLQDQPLEKDEMPISETEKAVLPLRLTTVTESLRTALEKQAVRSGLSINELVIRLAAGAISLREKDLTGIFEAGDLADNQAIAPIALPTSAS